MGDIESLTKAKDKLAKQLKDWEKEFAKKTGAKPTKEEKKADALYYELYKKYTKAEKNLKKVQEENYGGRKSCAASADGQSMQEEGESRKSAPRKKSIFGPRKSISRQMSILLGIENVTKAQNSRKRNLKIWERDFEKRTGTKATSADKKKDKNYLSEYKTFKDIEHAVHEKNIELDALDKGLDKEAALIEAAKAAEAEDPQDELEQEAEKQGLGDKTLMAIRAAKRLNVFKQRAANARKTPTPSSSFKNKADNTPSSSFKSTSEVDGDGEAIGETQAEGGAVGVKEQGEGGDEGGDTVTDTSEKKKKGSRWKGKAKGIAFAAGTVVGGAIGFVIS